jgi:hypothetical protein
LKTTRGPSSSRVYAGSNTYTVAVRGDKKGSLKSETVKYGALFQDTGRLTVGRNIKLDSDPISFELKSRPVNKIQEG